MPPPQAGFSCGTKHARWRQPRDYCHCGWEPRWHSGSWHHIEESRSRMIVQAKLESLKGIKPHEWVVRFLFGGAVCVIAGLIAKRFGPEIGGLFLAFPAIFPAGASMVEAHEKKHKARQGF